MMIGQVNRENWVESFDAENTRKNVKSSLLQLDSFYQNSKANEQEVFDFLKKSDEVEVYFTLRDIANFLQTQVGFNTAKLYFNYIKMWYRENRIVFEDRRLNTYLKWKRPLRERKYTPNDGVLNQIILSSKEKYQSFWLFLMSTGCRQGEALQLKVKDIDVTTSPVKVHFPAEITKTRQERIGFLTREASNALQYRLGNDPEKRVFHDITASGLHKAMNTIRKKIGQDDKFSTNRAKLTPHRFRAHYKKIMDRTVSSDFSHFMLGHAGALSTYDGDNDEGIREDFLKAENALTIDLKRKFQEEKRKNDDLSERIKKIEEQLRKDLTT